MSLLLGWSKQWRLFGGIRAPAFHSLNIGILAALGVGVLAYKIVGRFQMKSKPIRYNPKVVVNLVLVICLLVGTAITILTVTHSAKTATADVAGWSKVVIDGEFGGTGRVYAVDVDSDGDMDVLGVAASDDDIAWWENDGNQNFSKNVINGSFDGASWVYATDIDGDSDVDVLGTAQLADDVAWWENDGSENFTQHTIDGNFDGAKSVYASDVDEDGDIDILGAAFGPSDIIVAGEIAWWKNDGNENFNKQIVDANYDGAHGVYAVDIDGDTDIDILGCAYLADDISWWENDGNENFTPHTIARFDGVQCVHADDVDGDGDMDVLGAASYADQVVWWENDGNENFTPHIIESSIDSDSVYTADVDSDCDIDVLMASDDNRQVNWYENDGNENFTKRNIDSDFHGGHSVYAADVDSDGDMDVLGAATNINDIAWYENLGMPPAEEFIADANTVALWHFNEGTGTTVADSSGNGHDGTIVGATWVNEGLRCHALNFSTGAYVEVPDGPGLDGMEELTIEAWVFMRSYPPTSAPFAPIVAKWGPGVTEDDSYKLYVLYTGQLAIDMCDGSNPGITGSSLVYSTDLVPLQEWTLVKGTWEKPGEVHLYINGVESEGIPFDPNVQDKYVIQDTTQPVWIGYEPTGGDNYFDGIIDEVRISNIVREVTPTPTPTPTPPAPSCFIATAAYGTSTAAEIDTLRDFRDNVLLKNSLGSQLVALYYEVSPPVADFISEHEPLRTLVRELLVDPVAWLVEATGTLWRD